MKTGTSLTLMAIGAIIAFAITAHPRFLNFTVAGLVIMATGAAGLLLPSRKFGWLRRRVVVHQNPGSGQDSVEVDEERYPPYVMLNPAALDSVQPEPEPVLTADGEVAAPEEPEQPEWEIRPKSARSPSGSSEMVAEVFEE